MRKFAVIGLGAFGTGLARNLARLGGVVLAIDNDMAHVDAVKNDVHTAILMDARDREALRERDVHAVECAVVCMGEDFEAAEICAVHLTELGCPRVMVRGTSDERAEILKVLVPGVIQPGLEAARELAARLLGPGLIAYACLMGAQDVAVVRISSGLQGKSVGALGVGAKIGVHVLALLEGGAEGKVRVGPSSETKVTEGDLLYLLGEETDLIHAANRIAGAS